jgi:hypothetical protein
MKNCKITLLSFLFLAIFTFVGCGGDEPVTDEPDTTKPTISISKPLSDAEFSLGDVILLSGEIKDNEGLKSISITVAFSGDKSASIVPDEWEPGSYDLAISGKIYSYENQPVFTIPSEDILTGIYTITVVVTDTSNNVSAAYTISITIVE